jgi:Holliday junction resolvase RusA-like endonuclease
MVQVAVMKNASNFDDGFNPGQGMVERLELKLPAPVSANEMNSYGRGKFYRSASYRKWINTCKFLAGTAPGRVNGPLYVHLIMTGGKGWKAGRDLDNIIKPTIDLLRYLGVIEEDNVKNVVGITALYFGPSSKKDVAFLKVVVRGLTDEEARSKDFVGFAGAEAGKYFGFDGP